MSKCRYDLSEDCNNKDCLVCVLDKIRADIEEHRNKTEYMDKYDLVGDCLDIIDRYKKELN